MAGVVTRRLGPGARGRRALLATVVLVAGALLATTTAAPAAPTDPGHRTTRLGADADDAPFGVDEPPAERRRRPADPFAIERAGEPAAQGTGEITIVLEADPATGQDVAFTGCGPFGCGPFTLDDDQNPALSDRVSASGLDAGTYTVTQAAVLGWQVDQIACTTGETIDLGARRATIALAEGESVTCTFTLATTALTVALDARPDSGQDVSFTGCGPAGCGAIGLDDDADATLPSRQTFVGLPAGSYTATMDATTGWLLKGLSCDSAASVDLADREATVTLDEGEHTSCTFVHETIPDLTVQTVVSGQSIPWDLAWTPGGDLLWTERSGSINVLPVGASARELTLVTNTDFQATGEIGMMGLAIDPQFAANRRFYTCQGSTDAGGTIQVVGWTLDAGLTAATRELDPLVGGIPLASIHGGCRLEFAPDGYLLITTGDAALGTTPQSLLSLAGKVLRVHPTTGQGAPDNVFAADGDAQTDARIYTRGHRNVQGLAYRPGLNQWWSVEHGPNRDDEVNLLQNGGNYGWDPVPGYNQGVPMTDLTIPGALPARWSSGSSTIATSDGTFLNGAAWEAYRGFLAVPTLKDSSLRLLGFSAPGELVYTEMPSSLDGQFGRLRAAAVGPDGSLYLTTSNGSNDLILRVTPS